MGPARPLIAQVILILCLGYLCNVFPSLAGPCKSLFTLGSRVLCSYNGPKSNSGQGPLAVCTYNVYMCERSGGKSEMVLTITLFY
ncbi:hypothetical protein HanIR_Chr16g0843341 [Helianthus annuus]|nr:hypothetical protein HanIR_Chr16g0843341 [Helianthus annuus]